MQFKSMQELVEYLESAQNILWTDKCVIQEDGSQRVRMFKAKRKSTIRACFPVEDNDNWQE